MGKKKKVTRISALNELKTRESKWLKDQRLDEITPITAKVNAAKVAALLEHLEEAEAAPNLDDWPLAGAEDLTKIDQETFRAGLAALQAAGVLNRRGEFRKIASPHAQREALDLKSESGLLTYRCAKPGGLNLADRDEYVLEDQEVTYTEETISQSSDLQAAIANEWLIRIDQ